ncbi:MAG: 23S rRNA (guanosine(2251)-2'-O)-methyltransferase RlmB [Clostridiales bacterium]|nr:23S rRNA (guanosine(2251)-2'-O)-methyltransferase RlmB [Clostridiales bacterium]
MNEMICGKNSVLEALKGGRAVSRVFLAQGIDRAFVRQVIELCREKGVPYLKIPRPQLEKLAGADNRGVAAEIAAAEYVETADILRAAKEKGEPPLLLILAEVEDPHNLGAVMRTALCAGAHGIIIPKRRSATLNQTVAKVSAGAVEHLPVARVANLVAAVAELQEAGLWVVAADMRGAPLWEVDLTGPLAIVLGGEGAGIAPLLLSKCDFKASIPMRGPLSSLNVSAAAAVFLYEAARRRRG